MGMLPNDVARCAGVGDDEEGWREGCDDCARRTAESTSDVSAWMMPPAWLFGLMLEKAPVLIVWGGNYYQLPPSRGWLSWFKPDSPPSMANFELAWTNLDMNAKQLKHSISATNPERVGHPTQKPGYRCKTW